MVHPADLRSRLRDALDPAPGIVAAEGDRLAAVLVPLIGAPEPALVFTVRASGLSRHAGEVSFPGGIRDPGETLEETALRETFEEIGLEPSSVEVLGALPPVHTNVSGILVVPFVGMLEAAPAFIVSDGEIAEILILPVAGLVEQERLVTYDRDGGRWRGWAYEMGAHTIWGATGWMLHELLELIQRGDTMSDDMTVMNPEDRELRALLGDARTIAVVGLSSKPGRPSHEVAAYLKEHGYTIVPVNPSETEVLGERAYASLQDIPATTSIDVVDVFRRAEDTPPVARDAVAVGAKVLWLQEGIVNDEAYRIATEGGLEVIMGVCIKQTKQRLEREART